MRMVANWSGVMRVSWRFHRRMSLSRYAGVGSGTLYAGRAGLMPRSCALGGSGRAGWGVYEGMSISMRTGIKVKGRLVWAWCCLSVLLAH